VRRFAKYSGVLIVILVMLVAILAMRGSWMGWQVHTIVSSSMDPELKVGEVVVTREVDPYTVATGDIVTFQSPIDGRLVCHRVVDIREDSLRYFQTKGDANQRPDAFLVPAESILGCVQFHTSLIAHATSAIRSPLALVMLCV
jgi:signal peptidase